MPLNSFVSVFPNSPLFMKRTFLMLASCIALLGTNAPSFAQQLSDEVSKATKDTPFKNSLGMKFVPVPGTKALFCIHETRRSDYRAFVNETMGLDVTWKSPTLGGVKFAFTDDHPVMNVSWKDSSRFCDWLNRKEKTAQAGFAYRLPTDAEWSAAVGIAELEEPSASTESKHGKLTGIFPWGKTWPPTNKAGNFADVNGKSRFSKMQVISGYDDGNAATAAVMSYSPNSLGIFDLSGNVWEWCQDWTDGTQKFKILRGGSWAMATPDKLHSCARLGGSADGLTAHGQFGFRVVLAPQAEQ